MAGLPSPEPARGWVALILSLAREGGPATLTLVLLLGAVTVGGLVWEIKRLHRVNGSLWQQLVDEQKVHYDLAYRCAAHEHPPPAGEGR